MGSYGAAAKARFFTIQLISRSGSHSGPSIRRGGIVTRITLLRVVTGLTYICYF